MGDRIESREPGHADSISPVTAGPGTKEESTPANAWNSSLDPSVGDDIRYPDIRQSLPVVIAVFVSLFCVSLDQTILATAVPRITDDFHTMKDVAWYGSSFLFVLAAAQLVWGKLYTMYPAKWVFLAGLTIFEIGSLLCGLAPSSAALIAGRSIAGLGAGAIEVGTFIIIAYVIPLHKRPIYMSLSEGIYGGASVAGPLLGGVFTDHVSWRWCFYINIPLGAVSAVVIIYLLPLNRPPAGNLTPSQKLQSMDLLGTVFLVPGVVTLLLALQWGGSQYPWSNWRVILLFVVCAALLAIFVGLQCCYTEHATLPPRIVGNRNMLGAIWYMVCIPGACFVFLYYMPIWFQAVKGTTATKSGLMILPTELGVTMAALAGGVLISVVGYYTPFLITSSVLSTVGAGLLTTLHASSGLGPCLGYQVIMSVGFGLGFQQTMLIPQVVFTGTDSVIALAILPFVQTLSGSISLTIAENVFRNRLASSVQDRAPSLDPSAVLDGGATVIRDQVPARLLPDVLEAYSHALTQTFYVCVAMSALSLLGSASLQWKSIRGKEDPEMAGQEGENENKGA